MKFVCVFLVLAGCAAPQTVLQPVTVDVPVALPCALAPVTKPDFALAAFSPDDGLIAKTRAALVELLQRRAYEAELEAQIEACR